MSLSMLEATFAGTVLEGFLYGVYCIVFALYLRAHKRGGKNMIIFPLSALFILCTVFFPLDFTQQLYTIFRGGSQNAVPLNLNLVTSTIYSLVDFISQSVLIYRCWVIWGRRVLLIVIPSIVASTSLATSLTLVVQLGLIKNGSPPSWFFPMGVASFSLSLVVNTIVTALLVLKLILLHREITRALPSSSLRKGYDLLPAISILVESGMFTFIGQLVWVVLFRLQNPGFTTVGSPVTMIYGITPTLIIVRVTMGASNSNTKQQSSMRFTINDHHGDSINAFASVDHSLSTRMQRSTENLELDKIKRSI